MVAASWTVLPSCMVTSPLATYLSMYSLPRALSLTNISISTPWPKASWTIMPVVSGSQTQSYSPGGIGCESSRSRAVLATASRPLSTWSSTSAPPRFEKP